jgi:hypothetical protein
MRGAGVVKAITRTASAVKNRNFNNSIIQNKKRQQQFWQF